MSKTKQILLNKALCEAAATCTLDEVRSLVIDGANPNCQHYATGMTPLMEATSRGHFEIVLLLLEVGANAETTNHAGNTAFMIADQLGHIDTVREMICKDVEVPEALQVKYKDIIKAHKEAKLFGEPARLEPEDGWEERLTVSRTSRKGTGLTGYSMS